MPRKNFNLERSFYKPEHVRLAIGNFWEDFSLFYQDGVLGITAESDGAIDEIFHEFINHVTGLHNESI